MADSGRHFLHVPTQLTTPTFCATGALGHKLRSCLIATRKDFALQFHQSVLTPSSEPSEGFAPSVEWSPVDSIVDDDNGSRTPAYVPTLEEIATVCRDIQQEWSATERLSRSYGREPECKQFMPDAVPVNVPATKQQESEEPTERKSRVPFVRRIPRLAPFEWVQAGEPRKPRKRRPMAPVDPSLPLNGKLCVVCERPLTYERQKSTSMVQLNGMPHCRNCYKVARVGLVKKPVAASMGGVQ